ncbi:MAG: histidinol-phosphate transaminase [Mariniphaga sp.]|nr:histidinol-phosphate transaminase [Mariniphaga sp.]
MELEKLLRKNIKNLKPYSSARDEFTGEALVYLDANENPFNSPYNRYPDPLQRKVKEKIANLKQTSVESIFLGNGSDEPIDLLIRAFCEPGEDNLIITDPTYGMFEVAANINNIEVRKVSLDEKYQLNADEFLKKANKNSKLAFLCSPNNPTGNSINKDSIVKIINEFEGLVILDEAYIDFVPEKSFLPNLKKYSNLVILQTFSKAWGMAGIRLGMAFASQEIIQVLNKIKYPYNLNVLVQQKALDLLNDNNQKDKWVKEILKEKKQLSKQLIELPFTIKVFPSDANFLLVEMHNARGIYDYLIENKIIVRDRSKVHLCENSLRITVGNKEENDILINALNELI